MKIAVPSMDGITISRHCGQTTEIFKCGGGEKMAREMNGSFLGRIPLDP